MNISLKKKCSIYFQGGDILYQNAISKAVDFLARAVTDNLDAYSLAVMSTAFGDTRHPFATKTLQMMEKYANASGKLHDVPRKNA